MDRTTLTANLKPLERRGCVRSTVDAKDRRARRMRLTPAGRKCWPPPCDLGSDASARPSGCLLDRSSSPGSAARRPARIPRVRHIRGRRRQGIGCQCFSPRRRNLRRHQQAIHRWLRRICSGRSRDDCAEAEDAGPRAGRFRSRRRCHSLADAVRVRKPVGRAAVLGARSRRQRWCLRGATGPSKRHKGRCNGLVE